MTEFGNGGMLQGVEGNTDEKQPFMSGSERTRALLFAVSFLVYAGFVSPGAYWIDSGELAAAGASLGIIHAPGHPLYAVFSYLASLIPYGPMGFRIALLSGFFASVSVVLVYDLVRHSAAASINSDAMLEAFASLSALVFAASGGLFLQAVRAEVYTLNLALLLFALRLALEWKFKSPHYDSKTMLRVAFVVGLGLANHHLLVVAFLPPLLILLLHHPQGRKVAYAQWYKLLLMGAAGLLLYVYLPIRTLTDPLFNYGDPRTLERFWDVLMAKSFQPSVGGDAVDLLANLEGATLMLVESLGIITLVLGILGCLILLRANRWLGVALIVAIVANLSTKLMMVLDPDNPDAAGYFLISMALICVLAGSGLMRLFSLKRRTYKAVAVLLGVTLCVSSAAGSALHLEKDDLSDLHTPAIVDAWMVKDMPPGSILMPIHPQLSFNRLYHTVVDGYRPDLVIVHQSMDRRIDGGAPYAAYMGRRHNELKTLFEESLATDRFPIEEAKKLSRVRPIFVEPHNQIEGDIPLEFLGSSGLYSQIVDASDENSNPRARVSFSDLASVIRSPHALNNDEKRIIGYLAASTAVLRLKQGQGTQADDALTALEYVFPTLDVRSLPVRWGRYTHTLGALTRTLKDGEQGGSTASFKGARVFARHCDYSSLLPN